MSLVLLSLFLASGCVARYHRRDYSQLSLRDILSIDPNGTCPAVETIVLELQPVFFSSYVPYNTAFDPFFLGQTITITNAPTNFATSTTLTRTVLPTSVTRPVSAPTSYTSSTDGGENVNNNGGIASYGEKASTTPDSNGQSSYYTGTLISPLSGNSASIVPSAGTETYLLTPTGPLSGSESGFNGISQSSTWRASSAMSTGTDDGLSQSSTSVSDDSAASPSAGNDAARTSTMPSGGTKSTSLSSTQPTGTDAELSESGEAGTSIEQRTSESQTVSPSTSISAPVGSTFSSSTSRSMSGAGSTGSSPVFSQASTSVRQSTPLLSTTTVHSSSGLPTTSRSIATGPSSPTTPISSSSGPSTTTRDQGSISSQRTTSSLTVLTTSSTTRSRRSASSTVGTLQIGDGVRQLGVVTNIPEPESFIFLAYSTINGPSTTTTSTQDSPSQRLKKDQLQRRQASTASPVTIVDVSRSTNTAAAGLQAVDCDGSTPMRLADGVLVLNNSTLGKYPGATDALLGSLVNPPENQVNRTFSLDNGVLTWNTPSDGVARFFDCSGRLTVMFSNIMPDPDCVEVVVGAISGEQCSALRQDADSTVASTFTAPVLPQELSASASATAASSITTTTVSPSVSQSPSVSASTSESTLDPSRSTTSTSFGPSPTSRSTGPSSSISTSTQLGSSAPVISTSSSAMISTGSSASPTTLASSSSSSAAGITSTSLGSTQTKLTSSSTLVSPSSSSSSSTAVSASVTSSQSTSSQTSSAMSDLGTNVQGPSSSSSATSLSSSGATSTTSRSASSLGQTSATPTSVVSTSTTSSSLFGSSTTSSSSLPSFSSSSFTSSLESSAESSTTLPSSSFSSSSTESSMVFSSSSDLATSTSSNMGDSSTTSTVATSQEPSTSSSSSQSTDSNLVTGTSTADVTSSSTSTMDFASSSTPTMDFASSSTSTADATSSSTSTSGMLPSSVTSTPLPSCVASLPPVCGLLKEADLIASSLLPLFIFLDDCKTQIFIQNLDPVIYHRAELCLDIASTQNVADAGTVLCIENAIVCGAAAGRSSSASTTVSTFSTTSSGSLIVPTSSSSAPTSTPTACALVPNECRVLAGLSTVDFFTKSACSAALALATANADFSACFAGSLTADDILTCIEIGVGCRGGPQSSSTTGSSSSIQISTTTSTATATATSTTCLPELGLYCSSLNSMSDGTSVISTVQRCELELVPAFGGSLPTPVRSCLTLSLVQFSGPIPGVEVFNCLSREALCQASTPVSSSSVSTTVTVVTSTSQAASFCLTADLPTRCQSLSVLSNLALIPFISGCRTDLSQLLTGQDYVVAKTCLDTASTVLGSSMVACLNSKNSCLVASTTTSSTSAGTSTASDLISTAASTTSQASTSTQPPAPPLPSCLASLPGICTTLDGATGLQLTSKVDACRLSITGLITAQGLPPDVALAAVGCLPSTLIPGITGADLQTCLYDNVACSRPPPTTSSTSSPGTSSATATGGSTTTYTTSIPSQVSSSSTSTATPTSIPRSVCLNSLPSTCAGLGGTLLDISASIDACSLDLDPLLTGAGYLNKGVCISQSLAVALISRAASLLACLNQGVLCTPPPQTTAATTASSAVQTTSSSTSQALITTSTSAAGAPPTTTSSSSAVALPQCLNALPAGCLGIQTATIVDFGTAISACNAALPLSLSGTGLTTALLCVPVGSLFSNQANIVNCLNTAVLCQSPTTSATSTRTTSSTSPPTTTTSSAVVTATSSSTTAPAPTTSSSSSSSAAAPTTTTSSSSQPSTSPLSTTTTTRPATTSTSTAATTTTTAAAGCLLSLPSTCLNLAGLNGAMLISSTGQCSTSLANAGLTLTRKTQADTCITNLNVTPIGTTLIACLNSAVLCPT